jgi:hypothetical protein
MATKGARSKTKSSTPSAPATDAQSGPVTMTEALERLLPCEEFDGSPFKVADWLDTRHRQGNIGLLGGGRSMSPSANPAMLGIVVHVMPATGKPVLYVQVRQALGGSHEVEEGGKKRVVWDYPPWDVETQESLVTHHKFWAYDRTTFEQHFPGVPKNRGGRSRKYSHEDILIEATLVIYEERLPTPLELSWLVERVAARLEGENCPSDELLRKLLRPLWTRLKAAMA